MGKVAGFQLKSYHFGNVTSLWNELIIFSSPVIIEVIKFVLTNIRHSIIAYATKGRRVSCFFVHCQFS